MVGSSLLTRAALIAHFFDLFQVITMVYPPPPPPDAAAGSSSAQKPFENTKMRETLFASPASSASQLTCRLHSHSQKPDTQALNYTASCRSNTPTHSIHNLKTSINKEKHSFISHDPDSSQSSICSTQCSPVPSTTTYRYPRCSGGGEKRPCRRPRVSPSLRWLVVLTFLPVVLGITSLRGSWM